VNVVTVPLLDVVDGVVVLSLVVVGFTTVVSLVDVVGLTVVVSLVVVLVCANATGAITAQAKLKTNCFIVMFLSLTLLA
jgi:hypothetical protein